MPGNTSPFPEIRGFLSQGVVVYFPYPETDIIEVFENITSGDDHEKITIYRNPDIQHP